MKYIKLLFLSLSFAATFTACDMTDFGDINKDPNEPSEANTGMLFTYACTYVKYFSMNSNYYYPWTQMYPGYMCVWRTYYEYKFLLSLSVEELREDY